MTCRPACASSSAGLIRPIIYGTTRRLSAWFCSFSARSGSCVSGPIWYSEISCGPAGGTAVEGAMSSLHKHFTYLRRCLRVVTALRGLGWLLSWLLGAAAVAGWLDWYLHAGPLARAAALALTL